jgi:queuosine biosynthesis protein QueD
MRIFKDITFEAAHCLPNVPPQHKCRNLHGHHYRVRIEIDGPINPTTGWVVDFAMIDAMAQSFLTQLDHHYLNEVKGLENPTAENIAQWILDTLRLTVLKIARVTVFETPNCGAIAE